MNKEKIQEFTFRVTQASRTELVVIMYDIILADTLEAREALENQDIESYEHALKHAGRFLNELMGSLDYQYEISFDLLSLYSYVNKSLIRAKYQKSDKLLDSIDDTIRKLREAFKVISEQDTTGPVMKNTEQVYAGFTYGKGSLNEATVSGSSNRGFYA